LTSIMIAISLQSHWLTNSLQKAEDSKSTTLACFCLCMYLFSLRATICNRIIVDVVSHQNHSSWFKSSNVHQIVQRQRLCPRPH